VFVAGLRWCSTGTNAALVGVERRMQFVAGFVLAETKHCLMTAGSGVMALQTRMVLAANGSLRTGKVWAASMLKYVKSCRGLFTSIYSFRRGSVAGSERRRASGWFAHSKKACYDDLVCCSRTPLFSAASGGFSLGLLDRLVDEGRGVAARARGRQRREGSAAVKPVW